jgi:hypothetical protein
MGRARIEGGGTDGRYTIHVDYGSAQRDALLAALNQLVNRYNADIIGQQADVDVVNGMLQDQMVRINQARDGVMPEGFPELAEPPANLPPGSPIDEKTRQLVITSILNGSNILRANLRRYTLNIEKMKMERADALKKVATLTTAQASVTKEAWCCTFTETATAGAQVATVDINGESDLTLIAPMARPWAPADGVMTMPHVMSPEQSFFNTAILPGWQKHRPSYRWGTLTELDKSANTASVELAPATSSAQRLNINKFETLSNIPVEYMTCNAQAFSVGDRVVVQFFPGALPGDLDAKVIGFLDNPKPCGWPVLMAEVNVITFNHPMSVLMFFKSTPAAFDQLYEASVNGALRVFWRIDGAQILQAPNFTRPSGVSHTYSYRQPETTTEPGTEAFVQLRLATDQVFAHRPAQPFLMVGGFRLAPRQPLEQQVSIETTFEILIRNDNQVVFSAAFRMPGGTGPVPSIEVISSGGSSPDWAPPGYPTESGGAGRIPVLPFDYTLNPGAFPP